MTLLLAHFKMLDQHPEPAGRGAQKNMTYSSSLGAVVYSKQTAPRLGTDIGTEYEGYRFAGRDENKRTARMVNADNVA